MNKADLFAAYCDALRATRDELARTQESARSGMRVDGSHRPENRGERAAVTSQGYLAHALQERIDALGQALEFAERMEPTTRHMVAPGALIEIELESGEQRALLVMPGATGEHIGDVHVVSPQAPIVRELMGLAVDDEGESPMGMVVITALA